MNKNYTYNYVLFNTTDGRTWRDYPDGYYAICAEELNRCDCTKVVSAPLDHSNKLVRYIFALHTSLRLSKYVRLPLKECWYKHYFINDFKNNSPLCFLLLNHSLPFSYLDYLKNHFEGCKIVLLHRDLLKVCERCAPGLMGNPNIDLEMTFDKGESERYNLPHFHEFESKIDIERLSQMESDVFFAGKVKDRLPMLIKAYDKFTNAGLKCKYYLTGVPKEEQVKLPGVEYAESFMTYREMLYHTVNTKCVFEINQGNCDGYTSRFLEAVIYGKKLITNNEFIRKSPFYNPNRIQIVNHMNEIDPLFVKNGNDFVDYQYNNEFSPFSMIEAVENELIKKYGKNIK